RRLRVLESASSQLRDLERVLLEQLLVGPTRPGGLLDSPLRLRDRLGAKFTEAVTLVLRRLVPRAESTEVLLLSQLVDVVHDEDLVGVLLSDHIVGREVGLHSRVVGLLKLRRVEPLGERLGRLEAVGKPAIQVVSGHQKILPSLAIPPWDHWQPDIDATGGTSSWRLNEERGRPPPVMKAGGPGAQPRSRPGRGNPDRGSGLPGGEHNPGRLVRLPDKPTWCNRGRPESTGRRRWGRGTRAATGRPVGRKESHCQSWTLAGSAYPGTLPPWEVHSVS